LLDCDVVVGDAKHDEAVFWLFANSSIFDLGLALVIELNFVYELILDQNERLH
jgi:hypothetical protein